MLHGADGAKKNGKRWTAPPLSVAAVEAVPKTVSRRHCETPSQLRRKKKGKRRKKTVG
jgi:hypothetical protein